ncbi:hypothetical protein [Geothrix fuzhouensis]|uniref:hypothetical protein n=1 Tax=Geothrix fuzhouensis TaxID=2966451 RepID=UPI00214807BB|nr:hypothetical protein [Geothrix fuzhouensis]
MTSGRLEAEPIPSADPRRKGQVEYLALPEAVFTLWPEARAAYEARMVAQAQAVATVEPRIKRDPQQVVLRANPEALQRARQVQQARLKLLEKTRLLLAEQGPQRRSTKKGLPGAVRQAAITWLLTTQEADDVRQVLGEIPSTSSLNRWWAALAEDPSGESLRPQWSACGRPRLVEQQPELLDKITGAFAHSGSFALATEYLQAAGVAISEATLRRVVSSLDPAIRMGLRFGARKAQTDLGPYVRRRPSLPFQCWSIDGHTEDSMWIWEDLLPGEQPKGFRPNIYAVRDVGSGALLSLTVGYNLNRYLPFMAIAEAILRTGIIPETIQSDNGREVRNRFFLGDDDLVGYFPQLGMGWKDGEALWRGALPYNSRSKPVERDFLNVKQRFSALIPTFTGGTPSTRPGDPIAEALRRGQIETLDNLNLRLEAFRQAEMDRIRTIHGHQIHPRQALEQAKARLLKELGPEHPRFIRPGEEWRVLPSLKAQKVRGYVTCRIEGQDLRFSAPILHEINADNLTVRLSPWDVRQAWLCRGGELLDTLTFVPDGPELGAAGTDVVSLRIMQNAKKAQIAVIKRAELERDRIRTAEGFQIGRPTLKVIPQPPVEINDLTDDQLLRAQEQMAELGLPEPTPVQAVPEPETLAPQGRAGIKDRLDWCRYMLTHPDDADDAERRDFDRYLDQNPLVRQQLGIPA